MAADAVSAAAAGAGAGAGGRWCLCALLALAASAAAAAAAAGGPGAFYPSGRYGKRVETEVPLAPAGRGGWAAGRFGRSGVMLPRADRFFMGSRYGKRAGGGPALPELAQLAQAAQAVQQAQQQQQQQQQQQAPSALAQLPALPPLAPLPDLWAAPSGAASDFATSSEEMGVSRSSALLLAPRTGVGAGAGARGPPAAPAASSVAACVYTGVADLYRCTDREASEPRSGLAATPPQPSQQQPPAQQAAQQAAGAE
ncbi:hypothetical protein R5R35_009242 [Gryllus longicercus]|uniref:Uncharacterized protein n=1 Tax=Gryllus longicercus TaxID=2509291 RepID=A0AAN9VD85_9ORTH